MLTQPPPPPTTTTTTTTITPITQTTIKMVVVQWNGLINSEQRVGLMNFEKQYVKLANNII